MKRDFRFVRNLYFGTLKMKLDYLKQLDGIRFIAIVMVAIAHYVQWQVTQPVAVNFPFVYGVTLFFVLSGFLITRILLVQKNKPVGSTLKVFYLRRIFRIFPIYYLTVIIAFGVGYQEYAELFPWLMTYTINIFHSINPEMDLGDFSHLWSLAVEEQFYLVWPLLVLLIPKKGFLKMALGLVLLSLCYKIYALVVWGNWIEAGSGFLSNLYSLGAGGILGYCSIYKEKIVSRIGGLGWVITGLAICALSVWYRISYPDDEFFKIIIMQILWVGMFVSLIARATLNHQDYLGRLLSLSWVRYIGRISYGIYLFHLFIPSLFYYLAPDSIFIQNKYVGFLGFFGVSIGLATLSWFLIEKPIQSIKNRFSY